MTLRDRNRNPLDHCPDCGALKLMRSKRCKPCSSKAQIGQSRTESPSNGAGWYRARRTRPLGPCEYEGCTVVGMDRHHIDGNPLNNDPSNIAVLCRRHHMVVDGRIGSLAARSPEAGKLGGRPKVNR